MIMVEVFKTNVRETCEAKRMLHTLLEHFPGCQINFDLEDTDNILRVEHDIVPAGEIIFMLNKHGYQCESLV